MHTRSLPQHDPAHVLSHLEVHTLRRTLCFRPSLFRRLVCTVAGLTVGNKTVSVFVANQSVSLPASAGLRAECAEHYYGEDGMFSAPQEVTAAQWPLKPMHRREPVPPPLCVLNPIVTL